MKNKVLILSNKLPYPSDDGSSIAMARLLEALAMKELDLHYYAINTDKHFKNVEESVVHQSNVTFEAFAWNTSPKPSTALGNLATSLPYHVSRFFIPTLLKRLNAFDTNSFHTVILEGAFMGMYVSEAKRIGQQTILRAHNVEHEIWQRLAENEKNPLKRWYLKLQSRRLQRFESQLSQSVDQIWCISEKDQEWFESLTPAASFIPTAVLPKPGPSNIQPLRCHHLGALDWAPSIQGLQWFMTEIWPQVLNRVPQAEFHIAGNNPPKNFQFPKDQNIFFHGRVEDATVFTHDYGISIIPLLAGSGMRIKILENCAAAVPSISTAIGAEGIYTKDSTEAIIVESVAEFVEALVELVQQPERALALGQKAQEDILNRFGMQPTLQRIEKVWSC
ncbi:MAG: glycosyltransferase family 4 protein [Schleiferiaceae bacterium]|nr:glycosyltransferase family 4 protein [Schleiferiaceae bacterium]